MFTRRNPWDYRPPADVALGREEHLKRAQHALNPAERLLLQSGSLASGIYLKCFHRLAVEGINRLPKAAPFVIAANHSSHLDTMILTSLLPGNLRAQATCLAAADLFFVRPLHTVFESAFLWPIPAWRQHPGRIAIEALRSRLVSGAAGCILFPGGTREPESGYCNPSVGRLVAGTSVPVLPCRISGAYAAFPPESKFPKPRPVHVSLGSPFSFENIEDNRRGWQAIANTINEGILALGPSTAPPQEHTQVTDEN